MNECEERTIEMGMMLIKNREYRQAEELFELLIRSNVDVKKAYYGLIVIHFKLKRYINAYNIIKQFFYIEEETDVYLLVIYYTLLNKLNKYDDVLKYVDKYIEKYPNVYGFIKAKAIALMYSNKYSDVEELCDNNIKRFPILNEIFGKIQIKKHNYEMAKMYYETAIKYFEASNLNKEHYIRLYIKLAQINDTLNINVNDIEKQLLSYITISPFNIFIHIELSTLHKKHTNYSKALHYISTALNDISLIFPINTEKEYYFLLCSLHKLDLLILTSDTSSSTSTSTNSLFFSLRSHLSNIHFLKLTNKQIIKLLSLYFHLFPFFHPYPISQLHISPSIINQTNLSSIFKGTLSFMNVAIKQILLPTNTFISLKEQLLNIFFEVFYMEELNNQTPTPNTLPLLTVFYEKEEKILLITPLMGEHLGDVIRRKDYNLNNKVIGEILLQIARTILVFHRRKPMLIHKDIKPRNVLMDGEYKPEGGNRVVVSDFGMMSMVGFEKEGFTPKYAAPELFLNCRGTQESDVYSFAVLIWEMYCRKEPFEGINDFEDIKQEVLLFRGRPDIEMLPNIIPDKLKSLLNRAFYKEPESRPTFARDFIPLLEQMQKGEL